MALGDMVGIVGGTGPESTIDYYRRILRLYAQRRGDGSAPSLLINSVENARVLGLAGEGRVDELANYLSVAVETLARGGCAFAVLAANTPHVVFDEVQARSRIPLISIVEVTRSAAEARGLKRPGLIGTAFTMRGTFYQRVFARSGIEVVMPAPADLEYVHGKYVGELVAGLILDDTREALVRVVRRLQESGNIDGLILGGTELALILDQSAIPDLPVLDTAGLHIEAIVDRLVS